MSLLTTEPMTPPDAATVLSAAGCCLPRYSLPVPTCHCSLVSIHLPASTLPASASPTLAAGTGSELSTCPSLPVLLFSGTVLYCTSCTVLLSLLPPLPSWRRARGLGALDGRGRAVAGVQEFSAAFKRSTSSHDGADQKKKKKARKT